MPIRGPTLPPGWAVLSLNLEPHGLQKPFLPWGWVQSDTLKSSGTQACGTAMRPHWLHPIQGGLLAKCMPSSTERDNTPLSKFCRPMLNWATGLLQMCWFFRALDYQLSTAALWTRIVSMDTYFGSRLICLCAHCDATSCLSTCRWDQMSFSFCCQHAGQ